MPDAKSAVAVGLTNRAQLRLLRMIVAEVDQYSLPLAEQLLATIHPLLGVVAADASPLGPVTTAIAGKLHKGEPAVSRLGEQAHAVLAGRERSVVAEIRDAVLGVQYHIHLLSVARDKYNLRTQELNRLLEKAGRGLTSLLDLSTARLDLLQAESQWIDEVIELRIQQVRLEQAQGLLAPWLPAAAPSPNVPGH
jgi:hypothetical protein